MAWEKEGTRWKQVGMSRKLGRVSRTKGTKGEREGESGRKGKWKGMEKDGTE